MTRGAFGFASGKGCWEVEPATESEGGVCVIISDERFSWKKGVQKSTAQIMNPVNNFFFIFCDSPALVDCFRRKQYSNIINIGNYEKKIS